MICFEESTKTFYLDGKNVTYAMCVNNVGYLQHLYYGVKLPHDDLRYTCNGGCGWVQAYAPGLDRIACYQSFAPELSFYGTGDYREPTVCLTDERGDRLCELLYSGYDISDKKPPINGMPSLDGGETLIIHLADKISGFAADLYYTVYDDCDVIARRIVYKNGTEDAIFLDRAYSFALQLPENNYRVLSLYGAWAKERQIEEISMHHGVVSVDSKRTSSSAVLNPFCALLAPDTNENYGEVFGVALVYSSSFVLKVQGTVGGDCLVLGGINDFDFSWKLEKGESFETPEAVIAFSADGLNGMSRAFHDAFRNHIMNKRFAFEKRPVVINNWEGTYFNFDEEKIKTIVDGVIGSGIDTFVLDDAWFGKGRMDDVGDLGDWDIVSKTKLPNGMKALADYVHSKNMKFGLWFEPEMVSIDSELYRSHPDYAIKAPDREHCLGRHQCVLDLTRKDVRDHIVNTVNKTIRECGIDYVKWDSNRSVTESFSLRLPAERQKEFAHRYVLGLYDMCERIVNANPDVFFEGCSAGGGRFDAAMMYYFPQTWTSDNSDAAARTFIQYGTSLVYPLSSMSCHVTAVPSHHTGRTTAMKTRCDIAHLGATGYELDASLFNDEDRSYIKEQLEKYHSFEEQLVLEGDFYRIESPFTSNYFTVALVSKDKTTAQLVCCKLRYVLSDEMKHIRMPGLDENKKYRIPEMNITVSGKTLMNVGIVPAFERGDYNTFKLSFIAE